MSDERDNSVFHQVRKLLGGAARDGPRDAERLRRFASDRDEAAFELLVWRHAELVLTACRQLLRDEHAAEDAFQATFLVLFRKAGSVRAPEALPGWLYRVACRAALRARPRPATSAALDDLPAPLAPAGPDRDQCQALHEEVGRLPPYYQAVVVCCYLEERTHEEAARVLGWSKGTVAGRLARARELLKRRLTRRGVTLSAALALAAPGAASAGWAVRVGQLMTGLWAGADGAAGLSEHVVVLAEGVMQAMFWSKTKGAALALLGVALVGLGAVLGMGRDSDKKAPEQKPAPVAKEKPPAKGDDLLNDALRRAEARRQLRQLGAAIGKYDEKHGYLPLPAITDEKSKPLLSLRVELLPYLGHEALYKQFKLDEAWDSAHNKKLLAKMPAVYAGTRKGAAKDATSYQYVVGPNAVFSSHQLRRAPGRAPQARAVGGSLLPSHRNVAGYLPATTMLVVESGKAVPWTKPVDVAYDPKKPVPELGGAFPTTFHAAFLDGRVRAVSRQIDERILRALITLGTDKEFDPGLFNDVVLGGGSPIEKATLTQLRERNDHLKDEARSLTEVLSELREEVKALRWAVEKEQAIKADRNASALLKDNDKLEKAIQEGRAEAKKVLVEIERLKKATKKPKE